MKVYESLQLNTSDTGKTFGSRTQLGASFYLRIDGRQKRRVAVFQCKCGRTEVLCTFNLRSGARLVCKGCANKTHGRTPEYGVWASMLQRCNNSKSQSFHHYGGRGIVVCERWKSFDCFIADMGPRLSDGLHLDRINNDGNYEPGNCRWTTVSANGRNKRSCRIVTYRNERMTFTELCERTGIHTSTMWKRLKSGMTIEQAAETPVLKRAVT